MTVANAAAKMVAVSNTGGSKGPSNKNVNATASRQASPTGAIASLAGKSLKGPDKGVG